MINFIFFNKKKTLGQRNIEIQENECEQNYYHN